MLRSSFPHREDRHFGKTLSGIFLLLVFVIPAFALTVVPTMSPAGTPRVIQTPTPAPTTVATVQTVQTVKPQTTVTTVKMTTVATPVPTATMVPVSTVKSITQTYTPAKTGTPVIINTQGSSGAVTGIPYSTGFVSGPAGTPWIIETPTATGKVTVTRPSFSGTGQQATAGGSGAGASFAGDSPALAAAIAGTFNQSRLHQASLQDVEIVSVGTSRSSAGSGTNAVSGTGESYDVDMTAVKKGDLSNNCPDDTINIRLRGMDPASPVAGEIATGGSQLIFSDPSIRTINIANGMMTIGSLRHAKLFGILDLQYTEVSTITPAGPTKIDRPFWAGLPGAQPQVSVAGSDPCAGQAMGRQDSGMTPGVTPTPAPEYHATGEIEYPCPVDPACYPETAARCYNECIERFPVSTEEQRRENQTLCKRASYSFDYNCCIDSCMHSGTTDPSQLPEDQFALKAQGCRDECLFKLAHLILTDVAEQQSQNVGQITRI
jgi:hypothetical protein